MASSIQILRSTTAKERPFPGNLLEGQPALNVNAAEPGLFFKATDGTIFKAGPAAITSDGTPPNTGGVGQQGNCVGELWLDKSQLVPVLKVFDGTFWVDAGSGGGGGGGYQILRRWTKTAIGGETTLSGPDDSSAILSYIIGLEQLFLNGVLLTEGVDYYTSNSSLITGLSPLAVADEVTVFCWVTFDPLGPIDGSLIIDGTIPIGKLGSGAVTDATVNVSGINSSKVYYTINSNTRTIAQKSADVFNVKDYGAKGDDVNNDTQSIQAALNAAATAGGGVIFVPPGTYKTTSPLIVRSNCVFEGSGFGTTIKTYGSGFPLGNAIHIGWGYEWDLNGIHFNPQWTGTDATILQLLADNYSNIKESNIIVRNFHILHTNNGGSVWTLNATDFLIENLWCENSQTPVNIANDSPVTPSACARATIRNIYQIGAGARYDLLFTGQAVDVSVSEMFTDPNANSLLSESLSVNGTFRLTIKNCMLHKSNGAGKTAITIAGTFGDNAQSIITGNVISGYGAGLVLYSIFNSIVANNRFDNCSTGLSLFSKNNLIDSNFFRNNTLDFSGNIDATGNTLTNNRGIATLSIPSFTNPAEYNYFSNNNLGVFSASNSNTNYGAALRSRKMVMSPIEALIPTASFSSANKSLNSITVSSGIPDVYYKILYGIKRILNVTINGYAPVAGEQISVQIVGLGTQGNSPVPVFETLGTFTTSAAGDFSNSFSSNINMYTNGGYYLKFTLNFLNAGTEFRSIWVDCLTDD